ncbi:holin [Acinetobacter rudis]|uniref:Holin n=1 Tax=Acinetobacter rudis TaxID=632955 RepID=A0AAW8JBQ9_9GAMM|nr:holin [Acinetobacter rudis]MDQ8936659.1 holin [Acinetobacter rudis]MDQ8953172.1 holin [Acinetobacter rudis]MDQ9018855.1 holin [Acinetobacter rudis]
MSETSAAAEASVAAIGSKATLTGGATSAAGFFMGINWIGWIGVGVAVLGLLINFYFSYQRDRRERREHLARMKQIEGECDVKD